MLEMIAFHACYDLQVLSGKNVDWPWEPGTVLWQQQIVYLFIIISGMSSACMKPGKSLRRGIFLIGVGLVITWVSVWFGQPIHYGVINFMGCAQLLTYLVEGRLGVLTRVRRRLGSALGMLFMLLLVIFTYSAQTGKLKIFGQVLCAWPAWLYEKNYALLGFPGANFFSTDYVPVLPHIGAFWLGWFLLNWLMDYRAGMLTVKLAGVLEYVGKHSLIVYLVHQPVLVAMLNMFA